MKKSLTPRQMMILKELGTINLSVRNRQDPEVVTETAIILSRDLADFSDQTISKAMAEHRQTSPWWPAVADIVKLCRHHALQLARSDELARAALPFPDSLSDEQVRINRKGIAQVREILNRTMAMPETPGSDPDHRHRVRNQARQIRDHKEIS